MGPTAGPLPPIENKSPFMFISRSIGLSGSVPTHFLYRKRLSAVISVLELRSGCSCYPGAGSSMESGVYFPNWMSKGRVS
jgi:hypothetical protein